MFGQGQVGPGLDAHAGAGGHVVEYDGLVHRVGDGVVHGDQALLGGLVVVGGHHQQRVGPGVA